MPDFRVLGALEVEDESGVRLLGGLKQRAVLVLLVLQAPNPVSVDRLIEALWGEQPPRTAMTSLQNFISQLRKIVGPEILVTKAPGYALAIGSEDVDLTRFRRLVQHARTSRDPARRAEQLRDALALWRGSPLAEFEFEAFAQAEIARLEEERLGVLEERLDAELEAGRHSEVIPELEALVEHHPTRERLRAQQMLALYRSGRQAEALAAYQDARRVLVEQLGVEPGRALQQLHGDILRQDTVLDVAAGQPIREDHFEEVLGVLLAGRLVTVLGTDVAELSDRLAERFEYAGDGAGLPRVAQYVSVMKGSGPLYDEVHALLDSDIAPSPVHHFFASIPAVLRERGIPHQLIVTTSYDLALEAALLGAGEEFDVVSYIATGPARGKFCHIAPDGVGHLIDVPNTYVTELSLERRTVILKLHGQVDRGPDREWESFVITEDDYIDYLAETGVTSAVPIALAAKLRRSHFLFLGYTMADWNLRLVLNRLWSDQPLSYRSWAVQPDAMPLEREFWKRRDVDVHELPLEQYIAMLAEQVGIDLPRTAT
jgi:DNA-binding SARP family transcriptional activator